jgi:hypothetical protein
MMTLPFASPRPGFLSPDDAVALLKAAGIGAQPICRGVLFAGKDGSWQTITTMKSDGGFVNPEVVAAVIAGNRGL